MAQQKKGSSGGSLIGDATVVEPRSTDQSLAVLNKGEVESQIATAKQYPRNLAQFKENTIAMATIDKETAEECLYALPRGSKTIEGPSVRLAEIALSQYGNCLAMAEPIGEDDKYVYALGMVRDLENNIAVKVVTKRKILDKKGKRYNDDMVQVTAMAACAIAFRNAIFKVIPASFIRPAYQQARKMVRGDAKSLKSTRQGALATMAALGVSKERVLNVLGRGAVEEIDGDDIVKLRGLYNSVRNGEVDIETAFPEPGSVEKSPDDESLDAETIDDKDVASDAADWPSVEDSPEGDIFG